MLASVARPGRRLLSGERSRRWFLGASASAVLGLAGCGTEVADRPASGPPGADGFPARVPGRFGITEVDSPPARVVALGYGPDAATVLALGVLPVAATRNRSLPEGIEPWLAQALAGRPLQLLDIAGELPFERIAALRPDLIVATTAYSLDQDHQRLSQIAPVLAYQSGPNTDRWQDTTTRTGQLLGRAGLAEQRVREIESRIAAARAEHPTLAGRTFTFGPVTADGQVFTTSSPDDLSARFLQQLGLTLSPRVMALPPSATKGKAAISPELLDTLDADLMILTYTTSDPAVRNKLEADPLFRRIPAVRRGSYVALDVPSALAMAFPSVLSLGYALDQVVARLAAAVR